LAIFRPIPALEGASARIEISHIQSTRTPLIRSIIRASKSQKNNTEENQSLKYIMQFKNLAALAALVAITNAAAIPSGKRTSSSNDDTQLTEERKA
jgi:hypothetical protein